MREEWGTVFDESTEMTTIAGPLSANNAEVLKESAIQGMGIAMLPLFVAQDALADGRLRQVLPKHSPAPSTLYAVRLSRQFTPARVRLFVDFLRDAFTEDGRKAARA